MAAGWGSAELDLSVELKLRLNRMDPGAVPESARRLRSRLSPRNPLFRFAAPRHFVALRGSQAVGTITAMIDTRAVFNGVPTGYVGFFACTEDLSVARSLIDAAVADLSRRGARRILAPVDGSIWHGYRFLVSGFEEPAFPSEPRNPPWYPSLFERCGFARCATYCSVVRTDLAAQAARFAPTLAASCLAGFRFRPMSVVHWRRDLRLLYELSKAIFSDHLAYVDISFDEFRSIYSGASPLLADVFLAHAPDGTPAGFVSGYPDYAPILRRLKRGDRSAGWIHDTTVIKTIGVLPQFRRQGMGSALAAIMYARARKRGSTSVIWALMAEDNPSRLLAASADQPCKEYALYAVDF